MAAILSRGRYFNSCPPPPPPPPPSVTPVAQCNIRLPSCITLQWCQNGRDGISNHQPHDCLLNHLFRHSSKKTSKLRLTGLCAWGNSLVTCEFPTERASNTENVSIWWRYHDANATQHEWYHNPIYADWSALEKHNQWIMLCRSVSSEYKY